MSSLSAAAQRREDAFRRLEEMAAAAETQPVAGALGDETKHDSSDSSESSDSFDGTTPDGDISSNGLSSRPPIRPASTTPCTLPLEMQIVDIQVRTETFLNGCLVQMPRRWWGEAVRHRVYYGAPLVILFGTTDTGHSASIVVENFRPYFDVEMPFRIGCDTEPTPAMLDRVLRQVVFSQDNDGDGAEADLVKVTERRAHRVFGFRCDANGKPLCSRWFRVSCRTEDAWKRAIRAIRGRNFATQFVEHANPPRTDGRRRKKPARCSHTFVLAGNKLTLAQMFGNVTGVVPSGWVRVREATTSGRFLGALRTQIRLRTDTVEPLPDRSDIAPLVVASFDIECVPKRGTKFPRPECTDDQLAQIGVSFGIIGRGVVHRSVICLGETSPVTLRDTGEPVEIISCETERDVLQAFADMMLETSPDIVTGYNIFGFDFRYMADRALRIEAFMSSPNFEAVLAAWHATRRVVRDYEDAKFQNNGLEATAALNSLAYVNVYVPPWNKNPRIPALPHAVRALLDYETEEELRHAYDYFHAMQRRASSPSASPSGGDLFSFNWCARLSSRCKLDIVILSSSALGENELFRFDMPGACTFDLFLYVKSNVRMGSYKLSSVCDKFTPGRNKVDLDYKTMFQHYQSEDPELRAVVAEYCSMDCDLPILICEATGWIGDIVEMSRVCYTSLPDLVTRGQQVKVYSQIARYAEQWGFAMNHEVIPPPTGGYEGATVLEPNAGYYRVPIATLDFASLYPSIMQAHNLCFSTYIMERNRRAMQKLVDRGKLSVEKIQTGVGEHWFVDRASFVGLLPRLLAHLLGARRAVKKIMKKEADPRRKKLLDSKQKSLKISCNSVYGFTGVQSGRMPCYPISSSTTSLGRQMIEDTKSAVECKYPGAEVIYGDSVAPWTPITARVDGEVQTLLVGEFAKKLGSAAFDAQPDGKETCELHDNIMVLTSTGWCRASRIIRHRLEKPLLRVHTNVGWIDVTEDHSMIREDGTVVPPKDLKVADRLLPSALSLALPSETRQYADIRVAVIRMCTRRESVPKTIHITLKRDVQLARLMGATLRDLADERFFFPTTLLTRGFVKRAAQRLHPEFVWADEQNGVVGTASGGFKQCESEIRRMYQRTALEYPSYLINGGNVQEIAEYMYCCLPSGQSVVVRDSCSALRIRTLAAIAGIRVKVRCAGTSVFTITEDNTRDAGGVVVLSVEEQPSVPVYVYDFTVPGAERFDANGICVHNTDSVMVKFPNVPPTMEGMKQCFALGEEAAAHVTDVTFGPWPEKVLEMEKASYPYILFKKKRYIARIYERPNEDDGEYDYKGVELKRRDNSLFLRHLYKKCLENMVPLRGEALTKEAIVQQVRVAVHAQLQRLMDNEIPASDFVISKSLKKTYKNPNLPHVVLAEKMRKRIHDGLLVAEPPQAGDRIDYVVVEGKPKEKLCYRTEDPKWCEDHGIKLDREYYIRQQIQKPMMQLLGPFDGTVMDLLDTACMEIKRQRMKTRRIDSFFTTSAAATPGAAGGKKRAALPPPSPHSMPERKKKKKKKDKSAGAGSLSRFFM